MECFFICVPVLRSSTTVANGDAVFIATCHKTRAYFQFVFICEAAFDEIIGQSGIHARDISNVYGYVIDRKIVRHKLIGKIGKIGNFSERAISREKKLYQWASDELQA